MARRVSQRRLSQPATPLAAVLDEQGRRLVWVADRLGVDPSTVSRWRSGERSIPLRRRTELAAILGVEVTDLVDPATVVEASGTSSSKRATSAEARTRLSVRG